jgi:large subunit ribosomal protein L29
MKAKDMREKSAEDLLELEKSLKGEAFQARFKNFTNRLDDTSSLKKARRDVARVKTIFAERAHIGEATPSKSDVAKPAQAPTKKTVKGSAAAAKPVAKSKTRTKASDATSRSEASK